MKKLRWGLLSTANINRVIIPVLRNSARGELVAVASRDRAKGEAYAKNWNIPRVYGSYEEMLAADDIDVIYNSTPNALHAEWAIKSVEAGKHTLVEKPFGITVQEVDQMIAAVKRTGKIMAEAFMYRHHPQTLKLQEILTSGVLGEVAYVRGTFSFNVASEKNVRLNPSLGGGSLWDVGCYPMSLAQFVFGERPQEVFGWQRVDHSGVDVIFCGQLRYSGNRAAQIDSSFRLPTRTYAEVIGNKGSVILNQPFKPDAGSTLTLKVGDKVETLSSGDNSLYEGEVENLHDAILNGATPRISLQESRDHIATLCALYQSARENRSIPI